MGEGYTFYWRGLAETEPRLHVVGFAIRISLLRKLPEAPIGISERIMTIRIPLANKRFVTLVSCYAPTLNLPEDVKDQFYEQMDQILFGLSRNEKVVILGDFNARVGTNYDVWRGIIGRHGVGKENANGLRLLDICASHDLCITNTMFQLPSKLKTTWMHQRSRHWHMIDYVITRRSDLQDFIITRVFRGAECWTDHRLIRSTVKFVVRPPVRRQARKKKINCSPFHDPTRLQELKHKLAKAVDRVPIPPFEHAEQLSTEWTYFTNTLFMTAVETFGFTQRSHQDWFDQNHQQIRDLLIIACLFACGCPSKRRRLPLIHTKSVMK